MKDSVEPDPVDLVSIAKPYFAGTLISCSVPPSRADRTGLWTEWMFTLFTSAPFLSTSPHSCPQSPVLRWRTVATSPRASMP